MINLDKNGKTWKKRENWSSEVELYEFIFGLVRSVKPKMCLELGTFKGEATTSISLALAANEEGGKVITLDIKDFGQHEELRAFSNCEVIIGRSPHNIPKNIYDFVFIDSEHSYNQVLLELRTVDKMTESGAYILLHDVLNEKWGGNVQRAIDTFLKERTGRYEFMVIDTYNGLGIIKKL